jgi:hypothetical protein
MLAMGTFSTPLKTSSAAQRTQSVTDPDLDARDMLELVREAMRRACGSQKAAAFELGIDQGQLSRQFAGLERFPIEALAKSPRICEEFAFLLAQRLGFQPRSASVNERRRQRLRMLKVMLLAELDEDMAESA